MTNTYTQYFVQCNVDVDKCGTFTRDWYDLSAAFTFIDDANIKMHNTKFITYASRSGLSFNAPITQKNLRVIKRTSIVREEIMS